MKVLHGVECAAGLEEFVAGNCLDRMFVTKLGMCQGHEDYEGVFTHLGNIQDKGGKVTKYPVRGSIKELVRGKTKTWIDGRL